MGTLEMGKDEWHSMYLGAFVALGVSNTDAATQLVEVTETTEECVHAIMVMRRSREGDRVWPALESLRAIREQVAKLPRIKDPDGERPRASEVAVANGYNVTAPGFIPTMSKPFPPAEDDDRAEMQGEPKR